MSECCHMTYRCFCGALPNSPDCTGEEVPICEAEDDKCGYEGDVTKCPIWQQDRADALELQGEDRQYEAKVDEEAERRE